MEDSQEVKRILQNLGLDKYLATFEGKYEVTCT